MKDHVCHFDYSIIMGRDHKSLPLLSFQPSEKLDDFQPSLLVKVSRRLVDKNERRIIGDCTCDRNALLLSSDKLSGKMFRPISEPNHADQLLCQFLIPSAITPSSQFHHQFHVLLGGQSRD